MTQPAGRCHVGVLLLTLSMVGGTVAHATAQTTAFALFDGSCVADCPPSRIVEFDLDRGAVVSVVPLPCRGAGLDISADGRYLTWLEACGRNFPYAWSRWALDRASGQRVSLGAGAILGMQSHPSQVRFLWAEGGALVSLTRTGRTSVPMSGCGASFFLSPDGTRFLQDCVGLSDGITVRDTASGAIVQEFSGALRVHVGGMALDERGDNLYWGNDVGRDGNLTVFRYSVATGLLEARYVATTGNVAGHGPLVERRSGRVFARAGGALTALHPVTLVPLGTVPLSGSYPESMAFHPTRALAYVVSRSMYGSNSDVLDIVDTVALRVIASVPLEAWPDGLASFIVAPHPPPPTTPAATVTSRRVSVAWSSGPKSPAITQYELEVAVVAGGPALLTVAVDGLALAFDNVPPGTFYVRVRSRNYAGVSAASGEITVRVR
ncbi:MAG: fibronectin type III domain-containing protein [Acidobacteriota bacterium]